jgi:hypothetical protein
LVCLEPLFGSTSVSIAMRLPFFGRRTDNVFEGEAGTGKTRVWEETVSRASNAGLSVLTARAVGSEVQLSFARWSDRAALVGFAPARS